MTELFNIGRDIGRKSFGNGLDWNRLKELQIAKPFRGSRGGTEWQRQIKTVVSARDGLPQAHIAAAVNNNNIIVLPRISETNKCIFPIMKCVRNVSQISIGEKFLAKVKTDSPPTSGGHNVPIQSIISPCIDSYHHEGRGVQHSNLTQIEMKHNHLMEVAFINARSVCNKSLAICDYVVENNIDVLGITETWLKADNDAITVGEITPPGYTLEHIPRASGRRGGGVGMMFRNNLKMTNDTGKQFKSFEHIVLKISTKSTCFRFIVVYRPPSTSKTGQTVRQFADEFSTLLEHVMLAGGKLVIMGDFNIHVDHAALSGHKSVHRFIGLVWSK